MKKNIIAGILMFSFCAVNVSPLSASGNAECPYKGQASADKKLTTLTKKLSLNKDQQSQVKTVLDESMGQGEGRMTSEECSAMDDKIKSVLDDNQKAKYDKMYAMKQDKSGAACCMPGADKTK